MNRRMNSGIRSTAKAATFPSMEREEPWTTASGAWVTVPSKVRTSPVTVAPAWRSAVPLKTVTEPTVVPAMVAVPSITTTLSTVPSTRAFARMTIRVSTWSPLGTAASCPTASTTLREPPEGSAAMAAGTSPRRRTAAVATARRIRDIEGSFVRGPGLGARASKTRLGGRRPRRPSGHRASSGWGYPQCRLRRLSMHCHRGQPRRAETAGPHPCGPYSARCDSSSPSAATTPSGPCSPSPATRAPGWSPRAGSPSAMDIPVRFLPQVLGDLGRAGPRRGGPGPRRRLPARARGLGRSACSRSSRRSRATAGRRSCVLRGGPCGGDGFCDVHAVFFAGQERAAGAVRPASATPRSVLAGTALGAGPSGPAQFGTSVI